VFTVDDDDKGHNEGFNDDDRGKQERTLFDQHLSAAKTRPIRNQVHTSFSDQVRCFSRLFLNEALKQQPMVLFVNT